MWGTFLSEPLDIVGLVGRYPANYLMSREPIRHLRGFRPRTMPPKVIWGVRRRFHLLSPCDGHVAHALRTLPPVAARVLPPRAAPRLACVKPAASVHPEPGSNSSLYILYTSRPILTPSFHKRNQRSRSLSCSRYLLVLPSVFSMNFSIKSRSPRERDCKGSNYFLTRKLFCKKIQKIICRRSS